MRMWAIVIRAWAEAMDFSKSFASLRHRPSHANVRSTSPAPENRGFRVFTSGQKRRVTHPVDQARAAAALGDRAGHRPSRGRAPHGPQLSSTRTGRGDNATLADAGYNVSLIINWLRMFLCLLLARVAQRKLAPLNADHCSLSTPPPTT